MLEEFLLYLFVRFVLLLRERPHEGNHSLRFCGTWKNAVYRDAAPGNGLGYSARDGKLSSFCHAIMHHLRRNLYRGLTRDKENATPVLLKHQGKIVTCEPDAAHHVDFEESLPIIIRDLYERLRLKNSDVVYEHIYGG